MNYENLFMKWDDLYDDDGKQLIDNSLLFPVPDEMEEEPTLFAPPPTGGLVSFAAQQEEKVSLKLLVPRKYQRTIAPGRDFYVTGTIKVPSGQSIPDNALFRVQLKEKSSGRIVREVWSCKKDNRDAMFAKGNKGLVLLKSRSFVQDEELVASVAKDSCMPDIVYCPEYDDLAAGVPKSFAWTWNKAYYTDTFFSALIYSGEYQDESYIYPKTLNMPEKDEDRKYPITKRHYDSLFNDTPNALKYIEPLAQGEYDLCVSICKTRLDMDTTIKAPYLRIDGEPIVSNYVEIIIGYQNSVALTVFGDNDHLNRLFKSEENGGATLIWDPLPGNWERDRINAIDGTMRTPQQDSGEGAFSPGNGLQLVMNSKRTVFCDVTEYRGGRVVFYDYKIQAWSYALLIELPEVEKCKKNITSFTTLGYRMDPSHHGEFCELTKRIHFTKMVVKEKKNGLYSEWTDFDYDGKDSLEYEIDQSMWDNGLEVTLTGVCMLPENPQLGTPNERGEYHDVERFGIGYYNVFPKGEEVQREIGTQKFYPDTFVRMLEFEHSFEFSKNTLAFHETVLIWPSKVSTTKENVLNPSRPQIALRKKKS